MSMLVRLPDEVSGLPSLEASLSGEALEETVNALAPTRVAVALPKFEVDPPGSLSLGDHLAAMGMGVRASAAAPREEPVPFKADYPFLFVIRDNASGLVVFMGRVTDPTQR